MLLIFGVSLLQVVGPSAVLAILTQSKARQRRTVFITHVLVGFLVELYDYIYIAVPRLEGSAARLKAREMNTEI